jgi:D-proline reductase (dithiol) PrdB
MKMPTSLVHLGARLFTRKRSVLSLWERHSRGVTFPDVPWVPLARPSRDLIVAMVTTAGVHLRTDLPFAMSDRAGDPSFREIPSGAQGPDLMVTHDYYAHRDADRDSNVVFPIDRLRVVPPVRRAVQRAIDEPGTIVDLGIGGILSH